MNHLLENEFVLGEENYDALANTIIMANKESWFLRRPKKFTLKRKHSSGIQFNQIVP